jgi:hypothetical protein
MKKSSKELPEPTSKHLLENLITNARKASGHWINISPTNDHNPKNLLSSKL